MTSSELGTTVELLRSALESTPDAVVFANLPGGAEASTVSGLEPAPADLHTEANGLRCGSVVLFKADDLDGHQYLCQEVEGGSDEWLSFGRIETDPLMPNRATGAVWWFPDTGTEWWMSEQFATLAPDPTRFFLDYVAGPGYSEIAPLAHDRWYGFLGSVGLAPRTPSNSSTTFNG
ncbi:hypothetical protein AB0I60_27465 [Actinosynnema sp. NPDC050436]|uniref:hypothetical protein n=1 Tax=Actinosynnema sp. NPDC050436 TaxID=3155659 RepID=UPI0033DD4790